MIELERRGIPTVTCTAQGFVGDARGSAKTFGLPQLPLAVFPWPFTNQAAGAIRTMIDDGFEQIVAGLTSAPGPLASETNEVSIAPVPVLSYEAEDLLACFERMNEAFLEEGWADGFPLIPPTRDRVDRMLGGANGYARDTKIAVLEPGFGVAIVEKIAINAVMAGCRPAHLPIIIAAIQCLAEPKMILRMMAMSTGPHAPLILVNGPVARQVGLNSGCCALGPGAPSSVNTVIGRAVRLCMMNIGHTYPGVADMDTVGSPAKYSLCVAEREEASPWEPFHVEKGFSPDASTVTVQFVYGICDLENFVSSTPEDLCDVYATSATNASAVTTGMWLVGRRADAEHRVEAREHNLLLICPDHAAIFARHGWSKADIRRQLYAKARLPFRTLMLPQERSQMMRAHPELSWLWDQPDTLVPVLEGPECFDIAVVGASAGRGAFFWGAGEPVTKPILT